MKVVAYPADRFGCGHHRVIWPACELRSQGYDVTIVEAEQRHLSMQVDDRTDRIVGVTLPEGTDVVVMQRVTHRYLAQAVDVIRAQGVAVVIDVDDDLAAVHPANPAWRDLHPRRDEHVISSSAHMHSWHNLAAACRAATLVTTTTPTLRKRYAGHGRGRVIPNYLAPHYYATTHEDSTVLGWPAALHSHPDDPSAVGNAVSRLVDEGVELTVFTNDPNVRRAFGLAGEGTLNHVGPVDLDDWPTALTRLGVGIVPLADTRFNAAKSWLKPLELSAVGVPWVASPRDDYVRLHKLGCGVLVEKPKLWYRELRRLLNDASWRAELAAVGRDVAGQLALVDHAWRWWEAWEDAHAIQTGANLATSIV